MALHTLSLFTGYGGIELGLAIVGGFRTVCYVEREAYAAATIVARIQDQTLDNAPIWSDVTTFDGKPWRGTVHCITGGYPCQPFSVAGKRQGEADDRYLFPEVARTIREVEAPIVFLENVPGHLTNGFERIRGELQAMGYRVEAGLFSAAEIGAPMQRQRLFILGYSGSDRLQRRIAEPTKEACGELARPPDGLFPPGRDEPTKWLQIPADSQPLLCRMADGVTKWADRLRMCGNGVHPVVAAVAFVSLWGRISVNELLLHKRQRLHRGHTAATEQHISTDDEREDKVYIFNPKESE